MATYMQHGDVSLLQEGVPLSEQRCEAFNEQDETSKKGHGKYNEYTAEKRVMIGKYAAENVPFDISWIENSENTSEKAEYLLAMKAKIEKNSQSSTCVHMCTQVVGGALIVQQ